MLAVARYGFQSRAVAILINKDRTSVTRWLNLGLHTEQNDAAFRNRLDFLDSSISAAADDNASLYIVAPSHYVYHTMIYESASKCYD
jgi:hypothetical protein